MGVLLKDLMERVIAERNLTEKDLMILTELPIAKIKKVLDGGCLTGKEEAMICDGLGIDPDEITYDDYSISVSEAAKIMGISSLTLRKSMKEGRFPVGCWLGDRVFHIPRNAFYTYMGLMGQTHLAADITMLAKTLSMELVKEICDVRSNKK